LTRKVDIHCHIYPKSLLEVLESCDQVTQDTETGTRFIKEAGLVPGIPLSEKFWDVEERLRVMSRMGIDYSILSIGNPWLNNVPGSKSKEATRRINSEIAAIVKGHPHKFAGLGLLPVNSPAEVAEEVDYGLNELQLKGFMLGSRVSGKSIASEENIGILEECAKRNVPIYLHPTAPDRILESYSTTNVIGLVFPLETTVAAADIAVSGFLGRFPSAKIILSHLGGAIPFLLGRLDRATDGRNPAKEEAHDYFRHFFLDTLAYYTPTLEYAVDLWGPEKVMLGSDYPYPWGDNRERIIGAVERTKYNESSKSLILGDNAVRFFDLEM
jgi:predicted TIM-barrel fold metal-dependent hydrolase